MERLFYLNSDDVPCHNSDFDLISKMQYNVGSYYPNEVVLRISLQAINKRMSFWVV